MLDKRLAEGFASFGMSERKLKSTLCNAERLRTAAKATKIECLRENF